MGTKTNKEFKHALMDVVEHAPLLQNPYGNSAQPLTHEIKKMLFRPRALFGMVQKISKFVRRDPRIQQNQERIHAIHAYPSAQSFPARSVQVSATRRQRFEPLGGVFGKYDGPRGISTNVIQ